MHSHEDAMMFDVYSGGRLSRSTEDVVLEVPFQPIRIIGFAEEDSNSECTQILTHFSLPWVLGDFGFMRVLPYNFYSWTKGSGGGLMQSIRRRLSFFRFTVSYARIT